MELGCLQSPLTTSMAVLGNLWEGREGACDKGVRGWIQDSDLPAEKWNGAPLTRAPHGSPRQCSELLEKLAVWVWSKGRGAGALGTLSLHCVILFT